MTQAAILDDLDLEADSKPEQPLRGDRKASADGKAEGPKAPAPRRRRGKLESLEAPLLQMLSMVGLAWHGMELQRSLAAQALGFDGHLELAPKLPTCGSVLQAQAPAIAKTLNAVAMDDPSVYKWLSSMMIGGGWGAVAFACFPVANAIVGAHLVPALQRRRLEYVEPDLEPEQPGAHRRPEDQPEGEPWRPPNEIE